MYQHHLNLVRQEVQQLYPVRGVGGGTIGCAIACQRPPACRLNVEGHLWGVIAREQVRKGRDGSGSLGPEVVP